MSRDKPLNAGKMEAQEATLDLALSTTSAVREQTPSKRMFLSFQIAQIMAKKDSHHKILPLVAVY